MQIFLFSKECFNSHSVVGHCSFVELIHFYGLLLALYLICTQNLLNCSQFKSINNMLLSLEKIKCLPFGSLIIVGDIFFYYCLISTFSFVLSSWNAQYLLDWSSNFIFIKIFIFILFCSTFDRIFNFILQFFY